MRLTLLGLLLLGACASSNAGLGPGDGGPGAADGAAAADASPFIDAVPPAPDADLGPVADAAPCPIYQDRCPDGTCIATSNDHENCGGCGHTCAPTEVCSAGACTDHCLPGLTPCEGRCVDIASDDGSCGTCGHVCAAGTGCVDRTCVPGIGATDLPMCVNGGPPPDLGNGTTSGCTAQTTFRWAICSCRDINVSSTLRTDAYDSSQGPYVPGGLGGSIGMNQEFVASGLADVLGAMWASSPAGTNPSSALHVGQELHVGGPFAPKTTTVDGEAFVDGNVSTSGSIVFADVLHQAIGALVSGNVSFAARVEEVVSVPPPCDCDPAVLLPIASMVAARASSNDNALIGLSATALENPGAAVRLDLPCGRYYLAGMSGSKAITIVAHGHTALFIDGNVQLSKPLVITLDPAATLDVLVAGNFGNSASLAIGSPSYPALARFYIGGASGFSISSNAALGAFFYAPYGLVGSSGPLEVYGGVFAGDFHDSGTTDVHYDKAVLGAGGDCGTDQCDSCHDCGNQACVNGTCGACTSSSQCCAPLVCDMGVCVPVVIE
jgi:hypothetical protein